MKHVLTLAVIGALAASPAFAAGSSQSGNQDWRGQQQGMSQNQRPGVSDQSQGRPQRMSQQAPARQAMDTSMVRNIQSELQSQGYNLQVDGIMGPNTRQALRQFQQKEGLRATGQVDRQTLAALNVGTGSTQQAQMPEQGTRSQSQSQNQGNQDR